MTRPSWDEYFIDLAKMAASRGTCNRLQVGSVIVQRKRVIGTGYNGSPRGLEHCLDVGCLTNDQGRCIRTIHAEQNALLHCESSTLGATCYVTHEPCETCTKLLIQAGINRVVFAEPYGSRQANPFTNHLRWEMVGSARTTKMRNDSFD